MESQTQEIYDEDDELDLSDHLRLTAQDIIDGIDAQLELDFW